MSGLKEAPALHRSTAISRERLPHVKSAIGDGPQDDGHAIRAAAGSPETRSQSGQAERQDHSVGSSPATQCPVVWHTLMPPSWACPYVGCRLCGVTLRGLLRSHRLPKDLCSNIQRSLCMIGFRVKSVFAPNFARYTE